MKSSFDKFEKSIQTKEIQLKNKKLQERMYEFSFLMGIYNNPKLNQKKFCTKFIMIDKFKPPNIIDEHEYLIICFDQTIIIFDQIELTQLLGILSKYPPEKIYCYSESIKEVIDQIIYQIHPNLNLSIENAYFQNEKLKNQINIIKPTKKVFLTSIINYFSEYLIKKCYINLSIDRIQNHSNFFNCNSESLTIDNDFFFKLNDLQNTETSGLQLFYNIEKEKIFVLKNVLKDNDNHLFEREEENYKNIHHPFICKYFGTLNVDHKNCLIIEYIDGKDLGCFKDLNLSFNDKIKIIFQIMIVLEYLHYHNYVYRDLKPNNLILTKDKTIVLIDFNRMMKAPKEDTDDNFTQDFGHSYIAPEINYTSKLTFSSDIFSLGEIISFLFNDEFESKKLTDEYNKLRIIKEECTIENPSMRPKLPDLINNFFIEFILKTQGRISEKNELNLIENFHSEKFFEFWVFQSDFTNPNSQFFLAKIYEEGKILPKNMDKAIEYYTLASNQNEPKSQVNLGYIYQYGKGVPKNTSLAIKYYSLAAKQNFPVGLYNLGVIYLSLNKYGLAFKYIKQAAELNHKDAQYSLGVLYQTGTGVSVDLDRAKHYHELASEQNVPNSQYFLGLYYGTKNSNHYDIQKSINFLSLAAKENHSEANVELGNIFYHGKIVKQDIEKAIEHYTKASEKGNPRALYYLGLIYYSDDYIQRNTNKAIYYLTLAASKNHTEAKFFLGTLYYNGFDGQRDINLAIKYLTDIAEKNQIASLILGNIYSQSMNCNRFINEAIYYYSLAANQNNMKGQSRLGYIYLNYKNDIKKALHYFYLAANQNYPEAQYFIGLIYEKKIIPCDIPRAIHYYTLAAQQDYAAAQSQLGVLYGSGEKIPRDLTKSFHYLSLAAEHNHPLALYNLGVIYYEGSLFPKNVDKAIYYFTRAALLNLPEAQNILGAFYINGIHVHKNIKKGLNYIILSASQKYTLAQLNLAEIYYYGIYVPQNKKLAIKYFTLASQKNINARFILGNIYLCGDGIEKDINKAIHYFKEASSINHSLAKNNLGVIYMRGINVKQNIPYAIELFKEAINLGNDGIPMFNLASINLFILDDVEECIKLSIQSIIADFEKSIILLCLALAKKYNYTLSLNIISEELFIHDSYSIITALQIEDNYKYHKLYDISNFHKTYEKSKNMHFMYTSLLPIQKKENKTNKIKDISKEFYEGFGFDV